MYTKHTLDNGLRVVLSPLHETKSVTVLILFGVGSRYETHKINGISHFLEHMFFKGTKKRPNTLAISKELDAVGAEYNAFTGKDHTGYYIKISYEKLPLALDMISDMLFNSKFDAAEVAREKKVICEEIHMYKDNPLMYIDNLLEMEFFSPSTLGWDIAGDDERVLGISRDDLVSFEKSHYRPQNAVLGIAGHFDEKALALVTKYFGNAWEKNTLKPFTPFKPGLHKKPRIALQYKDTEQVQLAFGFPGVKYLDPQAYAVSLLSTILGGTMSSRLFISVRERLGLAYSIRSSHQAYQDTGMFSVQAGLDKSRIKKAIEVILRELSKMKEKGVTEAELTRAKDHVKGKLALRLEDSESMVSWYLNQEMLTGKMLTPDEKLTEIYKVTTKDIKKAANEMFTASHMALAIIGPFKDKELFEPLLKL